MTQEKFNELFPSVSERTDNYIINIEPLNSGYIVNYGCQRLAIENVDKLIELLTFALKEPELIKQYWWENHREKTPEREVMVQHGDAGLMQR